MPSKDWIKSKDAELVTQAQDFSAKITATPTAYGFTMAEASTLDGEVTAYVNAYNAATDPATRTRVTIQSKDTARATLVARMRNYGQRVQYNPSVTDAQKLELGLNLRDLEPTPIPPPATQPVITVVSAFNRTARLRAGDALSPSRRGKPEGVAGLAVFSFVGATPPAEIEQWTFEGDSTRTTFDVVFGDNIAAGAQVWVRACWINPRFARGPFSVAVTTTIPGEVAAQAA